MSGYWRTSGADDAYGERRDRRTGPERSRQEPPEEIYLELAREQLVRIQREVDLGELATLPNFGEVVATVDQAVLGPDAISQPWMDPDDPDGRETAATWKRLGYAVDVPDYRRRYARNLGYLLRQQLVSAKLESTEQTDDGTVYQVRTGLIGENGRHAILVTRWLVRTDSEVNGPELLAAWPEPLPELNQARGFATPD